MKSYYHTEVLNLYIVHREGNTIIHYTHTITHTQYSQKTRGS